jgi:DNA-binding Lrp family transcriptional regulator
MLQHRADATVAQIASHTGYSEAKVRYTIDGLLARELIAKQAYIDVYLLGLSYQTVFFSLTPKAKGHSNRLASYLLKSPRVSYFVELGGEYDFCIDICVREMVELLDFMQDLSSEFGACFNSKTSSVMITMIDYPLDLCEGGRKGQKLFTCGLSKNRVSIDKIDHQLLSVISQDPALTTREVANRLGIPVNTALYRVKQLEKKGVICGYRYMPAIHRLGLQSFVHCVSLCGMSKKLRQMLLEFFESCPSVTYVLECTGNWDLEFGTSVYTAQEVIDITRSFQEKFGEAISSVKTIPMFHHRKVSKYPFPTDWSLEQVIGD